MSVKREEVVVIGDQLLTDVFGGNQTKASYDFSHSGCEIRWICD